MQTSISTYARFAGNRGIRSPSRYIRGHGLSNIRMDRTDWGGHGGLVLCREKTLNAGRPPEYGIKGWAGVSPEEPISTTLQPIPCLPCHQVNEL